MKHLHYKLSAAMFIIVLLLGAAFYAIDRYSVRLYYEELSQRLNGSLAMYVANATPLINGGEVDRPALEELANRAMVINPTAEIYLVAPGGDILGHALPPDDVVADRVDTGPMIATVDLEPDVECVPLRLQQIDGGGRVDQQSQGHLRRQPRRLRSLPGPGGADEDHADGAWGAPASASVVHGFSCLLAR